MMKLGLYLTLLFLSVWTVSGEPFKCTNICGKGAIIIAGVAYCCPQGYKPMIRRKMEDAFMATDCDCLFMMPAGQGMYAQYPQAPNQGSFIVQQPPQAPAVAVAPAAATVQVVAPAPTVVAAPPAAPPPPPPVVKVAPPAPRLPTYKPMYQMIRQQPMRQQRTWYHRPAPTYAAPTKSTKPKHEFFKFLDDFLSKQGYRGGNRG
uniref:Proline-rich protein 1 n=2 Tax=Lottia gigantea TaxID=225164 RepID=PRP1_LOTGI|nr:RecName: Full=Proline-rich protein 1; AltName: Full=Uncharacterized shell protein 6; Short=LUSP-6; Flags: Precursor [Lottia gigantea]